MSMKCIDISTIPVPLLHIRRQVEKEKGKNAKKNNSSNWIRVWKKAKKGQEGHVERIRYEGRSIQHIINDNIDEHACLRYINAENQAPGLCCTTLYARDLVAPVLA